MNRVDIGRVYRKRCSWLAALGLGVCTAWGQVPAGWFVAGNAPQDYSFTRDEHVVFKGKASARIVAREQVSSAGFGTLMQTMSAEDFRGGRLRLTGYLKTDHAARVQMWMRVDGPQQQVMTIDNMDSRPISGTTDWKRYEIVVDAPEEAVAVAFGFLLSGKGTVWADDFRIEKLAAEKRP